MSWITRLGRIRNEIRQRLGVVGVLGRGEKRQGSGVMGSVEEWERRLLEWEKHLGRGRQGWDRACWTDSVEEDMAALEE